jgi:hypothetical protein
MSLYGYKNVQLITHRTQRQIADSPNGADTRLSRFLGSGRITGKPESAGINRHVVGDARALQERK